MSFKKYLIYSAMLFLALVIICAAFNWLINPYDIFASPRMAGVNSLKPRVQQHVRLTKAYAVRKIKPESVIMGTSRAEAGIDPEYEGWTYRPVYNLALSGGEIYEIYRYFQHADNINPLKQALLFLDFESFHTDVRNKPDFEEGRLSVKSNGEANLPVDIYDMRSALFSFDALESSLITIAQNEAIEVYYLENGVRQYAPAYTRIGYHARFLDLERQLTTDFDPKHFQYDDTVIDSDPFSYYRDILRTAYQEDIDLRLVISPNHARILVMMEEEGSWEREKEWQRNIVLINEQEAQKSWHIPFPLWDFSGFNELITEEVPPPGDTQTPMRWWWDGNHFKKEFGDLILDKVFGSEYAKNTAPDDFGLLVNTQNIEQDLDMISTGLQGYRETHPQDIDDIKQILVKK